ncbi:MAG: DUF1254 domain-containing protein [Sphingopyxis sp.]|nr:DUF1254 domain-containing protein [Sphingopyxis sp.]
MTGWRGPLLVMLVTALISGAATIHALPHLIMGTAIDRISSQAGLNIMSHGNLATPENQPVVRPSPDLAYSACPYDLSDGPLRITVVPVAGRYSSLSVFNGRTDVIFVRNDVQARGRPYRVVVALPGQAVPPGADVVRTEERKGIALIRLLLTAPSELPLLQAGREKSTCAKI